jgi:hypothetical protein
MIPRINACANDIDGASGCVKISILLEIRSTGNLIRGPSGAVHEVMVNYFSQAEMRLHAFPGLKAWHRAANYLLVAATALAMRTAGVPSP